MISEYKLYLGEQKPNDLDGVRAANQAVTAEEIE